MTLETPILRLGELLLTFCVVCTYLDKKKLKITRVDRTRRISGIYFPSFHGVAGVS